MTAELAILNISGLALAADSAVTIGDRKIFNTANKLFNLNKKEPIGIMVYGNAQCLHVPWETIIKTYRTTILDKCFDTINQQSEDFINYVVNSLDYFPEESQELFIGSQIYFIFNKIIKNAERNYENELIGGNDSLEPVEFLETEINECFEYFRKLDYYDKFKEEDKSNFITKYDKLIIEITNNEFGNFTINEKSLKELKEISAFLMLKDYFPTERYSGIVICGYGKKEYYPHLVSYAFYGVYDNKLKYKLVKEDAVTIKSSGLIRSYAQTDMVQTFMEGISPKYSESIKIGMKAMIQDSIVEIGNIPEFKVLSPDDKKNVLKKIHDFLVKSNRKFFSNLSSVIHESHVQPILDSISSLPKEELAEMAESLVYLTYLKRRYSEEQETVGGAIDVAVISKGDGFIWIKRKHYFSAELNPHFFKNYFK